MKVALYAQNGSYAHSSLSIRCLRGALRKKGFGVVLVETTLRDRACDALERLLATEADLYGFSCYIWNVEQMIALARELRVLRPDARIVFGGPEPSFCPDRFLQDGLADTVIIGEGELAIVKLAEMLQAGEKPPQRLLGECDPDFVKRGIQYDKTDTVGPLVYYESSRGCPFSCAFCLSSAKEGVRAKSAEDTLSDLLCFEEFKEPFTLKLVDRTFNFDRERAKKIWRGLLSETFTKCYHFEICASLLDEECYEILSKFPKGKVRLEIGLQTTNQQTLARIGRHIRADEVLSAARQLTALGNLHIHLDLIAGLPKESMADIAASFDAAYHACDVLQLGFLKLLHGTKMRDEAEALGIRYSPIAPYTVLKTDTLSFAELRKLHRVAELLERLRDSGRFQEGLSFLLSLLPSPFAFFLDFSHYLEVRTGLALFKISQRELYRHLASFGTGLLKGREDKLSFVGALRRDYEAAEVRRPPYELTEQAYVE